MEYTPPTVPVSKSRDLAEEVAHASQSIIHVVHKAYTDLRMLGT